MEQSTTLADFLIDLVDDPARLAEYRTNREQVLSAAGLNPDELDVLRSGDPARVRSRIVAASSEEEGGTIHPPPPGGDEGEEGEEEEEGGTIHKPPTPPVPTIHEPPKPPEYGEPEPESPKPEPPPDARRTA